MLSMIVRSRGRSLLLVAAVAVGLFSALAAFVQAAPATSPAAVDPLTRGLEPIIVRGDQMPALIGAPVAQVRVYREVAGVWEIIPSQVDEVTAAGVYTTTEDGLLDANDEVVFMAGDLGDAATTSITEALTIAPFWYQIAVSDPLNPAQQGWAYIVHDLSGGAPTTTDYVDYDPGTLRVNAANYVLGWATNHPGVDYLSLFGGPDILDRTKVRVRFHIGPIQGALNEDSDLFNPPPPVTPLIDGAVRAILQRGSATLLAYKSFLETRTPISLAGLPALVVIDEVRVSTDLADTAVAGMYYNENAPAGVTIDGVPDVVPPTPFTQPWRQVSLASGTVVSLTMLLSMLPLFGSDGLRALLDVGGEPAHYYKDDSTIDPNDTGDQRSFGDSGVVVTAPTARSFTVISSQYIVAGQPGNQGAAFLAAFNNPLLVTPQLQRRTWPQAVYLPIVRR